MSPKPWEGPSEQRVTDAIHAFVSALTPHARRGHRICISFGAFKISIDADDAVIRRAMTAALLARNPSFTK